MPEKIVALARQHECSKIIVGTPLHWDGTESEASRKSNNLASEIRAQIDIPVEMWDEYGSTKKAKASRKEMGGKAKRGKQTYDHFDQIAATIILQDYLDTQSGY